MTSRKLAIGLDIGGTKIAGAVVDETGAVLTEITEPTPEESDAESVTAVLLDMIKRLRAAHDVSGTRVSGTRVSAIGVGAAGIVEWPVGKMLWAPNNSYRDWPVREQLEKATDLPVVVDNDANVAALAEARLGEPYPNMVLVTVGTGIGGGLVMDGRIYRGPTGLGAELGHIILNPDGPRCGCGNHGCFEAYASGTALTRMGRDAADDDPDGVIARLGAGDVTGQTVTQAVAQGDETAKALFARLGRWLGVGIASLANIFEVDAVVVGGGLVETGDLLLAPARAAAREYSYAPTARGITPIVPATFGGDAGKIGAALLALDHI